MRTIFTRKLSLLMLVMTASPVFAHFPWLVTTPEGKVEYFFGEDIADRTYEMPSSIAGTRVHSLGQDGVKTALAMEAIDSTSLVGLCSDDPVDSGRILQANVTYGVYKGTRLNYYALHQSGGLPDRHGISGRDGQMVLHAHLIEVDGGVEVSVVFEDEPLAGVDVKLCDSLGKNRGEAKTDAEGKVFFATNQIGAGLNGIVVGHIAEGEKGELDGKDYKSVTHYLTATFNRAESATISANNSKLHSPLREPLTSFGAAVVGEYLYVFSGHDGAAHGFGLDTLVNHFRRIKFDDPNAEWEELEKHEPAQSVALVTDGADLYRVGGLTFLNRGDEETNFKSTTHFARYNVEKDQWTDLTPLPEPRSSLDAAVLGRSIYVAGGWDLQGESSSDAPWHEDILRYDLDMPEAGWQSIAGPGYLTRAISVAAHKGKLYVIGGIQKRGITRKVSVYDPGKGVWSEGPELKADSRSAGFATSSFATGGELYVTGSSGVLYRLSEDGSDWEIADSLMYPRMFLRLLPVSENRLIALGGTSTTTGRMAVVESIDVGRRPRTMKTVEWAVQFGGKAKHGQILVPHGSKLYAFGGNANREPHDFSKDAFVGEAFAFGIADQSFEKLPDLPWPLQSGSGISFSQTSEHRKILLAGGLGSKGNEFSALDGIWTFDPESSKWDVAEVSLPNPRSMFQTVYQDDALWFFGGATAGHRDSALVSSVLHWWGDGSGVSALPEVDIPTPRRSFGGAVLNDEYFMVGGLSEGSNPVDSVDVFDFENRSWRKVSSPKIARVFPSLVELNGKLYLFGGFSKVDGKFAPVRSLEVYDSESDQWTTLANQLENVDSSMRMVEFGGRLLFYGIDENVDGKANFVLAVPDPLAAPAQVESISFGGSRRGGSESAEGAKALMRRDADKDGKLTKDELGARLLSLLEKGDTDGNGVLTYNEVKVALEEREKAAAEGKQDGDGRSQ